jgi:hypothetical protein
MLKYSGHKVTFKGIDHLFDLKERLHLVYGKENLSSLDVYLDEESIKIDYSRRTGGMLRPNSPPSRESFILKGKENVRIFKINNILHD